MSRVNPALTNFTAGEWSTSLYGRFDLQKYANACRTLKNFVVYPHGGATFRPGSYYIDESIGRDEVTNGTFSVGTGWTLGTGWTIAGEKAVGAAGVESELKQTITGLDEGVVYEVKFTVSDRTAGTVMPSIGGTDGTTTGADATYTQRIACGATTVLSFTKSSIFDGKLDTISCREINPTTRIIGFQFSITQAYILVFTDQNLRIIKDHSLVSDGGEVVEVSTPYLADDLFELQTTQSADVMTIVHADYTPRELIRTSHTAWTLSEIEFKDGPWEEEEETTAITPSGTTGSITLTSTDAIFAATDVGRLIRLESKGVTEWDSTTGYSVGNIALEDKNYICILGNTDKKPPYAMYWKEHGDNRWYWLKITAFTSTKIVTATVSGDDLPNTTAMTVYRMGAWCSANGYPGSVDYFEERLIFAGSNEHPQTIWASASGDYNVMAPGTDDDDAFVYTIAARGVNAIRWIVPQNVLLIGTMGAEWKASSSNSEEPMSATNISVKRQSTWGSKKVQALLANDVVLFIQRAGTKVRELTEDPNSLSYKYIAPDLSLLAEHITEDGIDDLAYQQEPIAIVWGIRDDGVLLGMTYERTQDVVAWYRFVTDGEFKSIATIPGTTEDESHIAVQRTIEGENRVYLEYFMPFDWGDDRTDCFFVDCGLTGDNGANMTITGATKADPVVITVASATQDDDDFITIESVAGMTELNENTYKLAGKAGSTYTLQDTDGNDINGTGFTTYASGGIAIPVAKTYSGADHLEGEAVSVLADGFVLDAVTVESGNVTIGGYYNKVHIGLGYTGELTPMDIEAGAQAGTSQGKKKRVHGVTLRLKDTMACKVGPDADNLEELDFMTDNDSENEPIPLFTGDKYKELTHDWEASALVTVVQDVPLPLTLLAILPEMKTNEMI